MGAEEKDPHCSKSRAPPDSLSRLNAKLSWSEAGHRFRIAHALIAVDLTQALTRLCVVLQVDLGRLSSELGGDFREGPFSFGSEL